MNLYAMLADPIRRLGDRPAVSHGAQTMTYAELDRAADAVARHYAELGCRRGDRVVLFLANSYAYPVLLLGAIRAGFIAVPVNAKLHPRELAFICSDCEPKLVVVDDRQVEAISAILPGDGARLLAASEFDLSPAPDAAAVAEMEPDDPAWIFYTSGTTGRPKGAVLSHRNLIAMTMNCLADMFDFKAQDRVLHVAPLSHGSGLYLIPALVRGAENVISDRAGFQPDEVLDIVAERGITVFGFLAPTMIVRLLEARPRDDVGQLRGVIYGGAPIHLEHLRAALCRFGPIFVQLYGQGEAPMTISCLSAADHLDDDDEVLRSAGHVRAGVEVRIVADDGTAVPDGGVGEIAVRGDVVMKGYWRNPDATAAALRDGWLHTGDIGRFDSGGRLHVLDRRHDTIISGGTNIYPKEIEDVIAAHPGVRQVIAFGFPDPEWGESVAVAVVTDGKVTEQELLDHCRASLASFKKPRRIHFLDDLPSNAYGKVLRRELKERFSGS